MRETQDIFNWCIPKPSFSFAYTANQAAAPTPLVREVQSIFNWCIPKARFFTRACYQSNSTPLAIVERNLKVFSTEVFQGCVFHSRIPPITQQVSSPVGEGNLKAPLTVPSETLFYLHLLVHRFALKVTDKKVLPRLRRGRTKTSLITGIRFRPATNGSLRRSACGSRRGATALRYPPWGRPAGKSV